MTATNNIKELEQECRKLGKLKNVTIRKFGPNDIVVYYDTVYYDRRSTRLTEWNHVYNFIQDL